MTRGRAALLRGIGIWIAIWTSLGLLRAAQEIAERAYTHQPIAIPHILGERLLEWYTAGAVTPFYIVLVRFVQRRDYSPPLAFAIYAIGIVFGFLIESLLYIPLENRLFGGNASIATGFAFDFFSYAFGNAAVFAAIIAYEHARLARERDVHAARLETELANARLDALRSQLDPHFVNNTLNGVSALLRHDPAAAEEMLARLGALLRATLDGSPSQEQRLGRELDLLDAYLGIMRVRFGERLAVRVNVPPELRDERVPSFVLQPLVENAIEHGAEPLARTVTVEIAARLEGEHAILLTVSDDGVGLRGDAPAEGIGIGNSRRRIERMYGDGASLALVPRTGGGAVAALRVPRRVLHV